MGVNPLVSGPVETSTPVTGTFLLEDGEALYSAMQNGDWVSGGLALFSTAMDAVAAVSDPLGTLIAMGLGWLMEHIEPLKGWLNALTGDSGAVAGFAATWQNIGAQLGAAQQDLTRMVDGDLDAMAGAAVDAYRAFQVDVGTLLAAAGRWSTAMATALGVCSTIVQVVHDMVRDAIAQVVGSLASYAVEITFSLGLMAPWVIEQVCTRVASLSARISTFVDHLLASADNLARKADELADLLRRFTDVFDATLRGGGRLAPAGAPLDTIPPAPRGEGSLTTLMNQADHTPTRVNADGTIRGATATPPAAVDTRAPPGGAEVGVDGSVRGGPDVPPAVVDARTSAGVADDVRPAATPDRVTFENRYTDQDPPARQESYAVSNSPREQWEPRSIESGLFTQEEIPRLDELHRDPAVGEPRADNWAEAEVGLGLEKQGAVHGLTRSTDPKAEFVDSTGQSWDVKAFRHYNFDQDDAMRIIHREFGKENKVMLDTRQLTSEQLLGIYDALQAEGNLHKALWWP